MIVLVIILQLILCFWQSIASVIFRSDNGMLRYYLALDNSANGNPSNNFAYWIISFLTFWMLFSYLVPISLFVTMEIVKFVYVICQIVYMSVDSVATVNMPPVPMYNPPPHHMEHALFHRNIVCV